MKLLKTYLEEVPFEILIKEFDGFFSTKKKINLNGSYVV